MTKKLPPESGLPHEGAGAHESGGGRREDSTPSGRGFGIAYAFLNRRERTEAEVRARLERAELASDEVEVVIAELLELGYVDDARYVRVFTQDKRTLEAWGNERIARSLRERGVERALIESALSETSDSEPFGGDRASGGGGGAGSDSELARAVALLGQRFPGGPVQSRDRERAFGVLARKGYNSETAADAVREWVRRAPE